MIPTMAAYLIVPNIPILLLLRFINGISIGLIGTVTNTAVVLLFPIDRKAEGISYFSMSTILATAVGPFFGLLLSQTVSYETVFVIEIVLTVLATVAAITIDGEHVKFPKPKHPEGHPHKKLSISNFLEPKAFGIAFLLLFVGLTYAALQGDLAFFMKSIGLAKVSSYFFLVYAFVILLTRPITGRLMDSKNENFIVYPSLILLAIGMFVLSVMHTGWLIVVAALLIGAGFGNFQSTTQSTITKVADPHRLGQATSTYFIFFDVALGFGPYLLGAIVPMLGYRHLFLAMSFVAIIGIGFYYLVHGRKVGKAE
jgi:MFS family permease